MYVLLYVWIHACTYVYSSMHTCLCISWYAIIYFRPIAHQSLSIHIYANIYIYTSWFARTVPNTSYTHAHANTSTDLNHHAEICKTNGNRSVIWYEALNLVLRPVENHRNIPIYLTSCNTTSRIQDTLACTHGCLPEFTQKTTHKHTREVVVMRT